MKNYNLALIGLGNVNRALAEIIHRDGDKLAAELGFALRVTAITDLRYGSLVDADGIDLGPVLAMGPDDTFAGLGGTPRRRDESLLPASPTTEALGAASTPRIDMEQFIRTAPADIVVEATFTNPTDGEPALSHVRWALDSGKSVCTTNKGPAAFAVEELKALAASRGVRFEFEGAVMSGTPVLRLASGPLKGVGITGFSGILNGTSNYILTRMEAGLSQRDAIAEAKQHGYAEADPTADIGGSDVRLKVAVLANELLGVRIAPDAIETEGITGITPDMVAEATSQGAHWKLIGRASKAGDGTATASVSPQMVDANHPLATISGATNAVMFDTEYLGRLTLSGPGAGRVETAYALLSDIIAIDAATS